MSAILYDKAILQKIKNWVKDPNMKITGPEETRRLFEYIADTNDDKPIELPLIALRRTSDMIITNPRKKPLSFNGWRKDADFSIKDNPNSDAKVSQLNAIPIRLSYTLDIYTRYYEEAEEYVRNFIFNFINYPKLKIEIPYNDANIELNSHLELSENVNDNSDIPERLIPGQFTRKTLGISLDGYLFDYKIKDAVKFNSDTDIEVDLKCTIKNKERLDGQN